MFKLTVRVPAVLQAQTSGLGELRLEVDDDATIRDVFDLLAVDYPGVVVRVIDEAGRQRKHVNVFVGPDSIRALKGLDTRVTPGADVTILPAVSGG
jgi:molybdopterin converting factor small subunit